MKKKIIRDSVHDYIEVDGIFTEILDSAEFQRLKYIEQISYRVLYPSARHDRFIHSLGTYHLGKKALDAFLKNIEVDEPELYEDIHNNADVLSCFRNSFSAACLLHDIGHAPFSHTCENFFKECDIQDRLRKLVDILLQDDLRNKDQFLLDYSDTLSNSSPKPHELLSAIIAVNVFGQFIQETLKGDLELVVRMIIGCVYCQFNDETGFKNCLIRMLNSPTFDVDKLDYILRDNQMSGFDSVSIDSYRLLNSITAVRYEGDIYPAFGKSALSVLENVSLAKTQQERWIFNHPVVKYDSYLLTEAIFQISRIESASSTEYIKNVFSENALSKEGYEYNQKKYRLLSDIDVLYDMKNHIDISEIQQYFIRKSRFRPVWKSFAEFNILFDVRKSRFTLQAFKKSFLYWLNYVDIHKSYKVNEVTYLQIKSAVDSGNAIRKSLILIEYLRNYCSEKHIDFDFVLLSANNPGDSLSTLSDVYLRFNGLERCCSGKEPCKYSDVYRSKTVEPTQAEDNKFFYLYSEADIEKNDLANFMISQDFSSFMKH